MKYTAEDGSEGTTPTRMWEVCNVDDFIENIEDFIQNLQILGYHYQVTMNSGEPLFFVVPTPNWKE